jgi:DeoR family transcriptional regulator, fructose operon transcriptional repressor
MFAQERFNLIRKLVRKNRRMDVAGLERLVRVSPATLRRDLAELEAAGDIIRVHGGVLDPAYLRAETSFDERAVRNTAAKKAIALAAAALIPPGVTVFVDAGSTCLEAGKALLGRKDIRVITHSATLLEVAFRGQAALLCIGGELRKVSGALTGAAALGALDLIRADVAFIGASGLDAGSGCSTTELSEAEMKKAILTRASRKILLADCSKWQRPSTLHFAAWTELDDWITDELPSTRETKLLRSCGLKIHQA